MHRMLLQGCDCDDWRNRDRRDASISRGYAHPKPRLGALVGTTINLSGFSVLFKILTFFDTPRSRGTS